MPVFEIIALILIFALSIWLIHINFDIALTLLILLSVLLHKEFFSIYRWDLLPVRLLMLAFFIVSLFSLYKWWKREGSLAKIRAFVMQPFVALLCLIWVVNGASIVFSKNLTESILLYAFFTTIVSLGITLFVRLQGHPDRLMKLIKFYIYVLFGLTLFGFIQLAVYLKTGFIFGALWNVPGRLPRIGATLWDVNHYGALLAVVLPVLGVLILTANKWKKKILYASFFVPMTGMLLLTNSRSAWIIAFVAFLSFLIIQLVRRWGFKGIYAVLLVIALASGLFFMEYKDKSSPVRAYVKDYFHYRIDSFDSHFMLLTGALQILEKFPYLGGGYGSFYEHFSETEIAPIYFGRDPISLTSGLRAPGHSIWGEVAAETGWIGISAFALFVFLLVSSLLYVSIKHSDLKQSAITSAMVASIIGWFVAGVFYSYKVEFFWLILFLYFIYGISSFPDFSIRRVVNYFLTSNKLPYIVFIFLGIVLIFMGLGENHLIPWDEAIYAKIAKNMALSKDFIVMRWDPLKVWYEKPPLYMWFASLSMILFGVSEFAVRLPSAVFGFFTVIATYIFGKRLFNKTSGFIAGLALLTNTYFLYYSRASMLDVTVTFFITMALLFYWKTVGNRNSWSNWVWAGIFIGLGALVKNVVGFLPLVIIGLYELYLLGTKQSKFELKKIMGLGLTALAVFLPWHIEMYRQFGPAFIDNYLIYHVIQRGLSVIEDKGQPFFWYLIVLKVGMRIWFVALLGAFPVALYLAFKNKKRHVFLILASFVILLFFSSAQSKLVWYIMPIYPLLSIMVGYFAERVINFLMFKFGKLNTPVFKAVSIYGIAMFAIAYLFLVKGLVYVSDLTGPQAELLEYKEEEFGSETPTYINNVQLPVIMYYLDGPFRRVEYSGLESKLKEAGYDEPIYYVTKESRQERIENLYSHTQLLKASGDYVFGFVDSRYSLDANRLAKVENQIKSHEKKVLTTVQLTKLNNLYAERVALISRISKANVKK